MDARTDDPGARARGAGEAGGGAPRYRFVEALPDLIRPEDYAGDPDGRLVRLRVRVTEDGLEVLGDAVRPAAIEGLLAALGPGDEVEAMLCG